MKKCFRRSLVLIATSMLIAIGAQAAGTSSGIVTVTYVINASAATPDPSVFIFKNATAISGTPACNTNLEHAIRLNTPAGKSVQQQVQLAIALGKNVFVAGDGTCSAWGDRETVSFVFISW